MTSWSRAQFEAENTPNGASARGDAEAGRASALFRKARDGDRAAYGQIVAAYQDRLFNGLLRMVSDPEETRELTQETFTRGLEKIDSFRGESSPYTWLFRIGMNLAINHLRRWQRQRTFSLDGAGGSNGSTHGAGHQASGLAEQVADASQTPPELAERRERHEMVLAALGRLDAEYRAVLVMRDVEGFDYQQMADVLGLPLGTLKSRLFRARLALRDELADYFSGRK